MDIATLPALSIRQPWAWLIMNAGKDIENRCWRTNFRGWFLIHAAKSCTRQEYEDGIHFAWTRGGLGLRHAPSFPALARGGIVGVAKLIGCVEKSYSPWFCGEYGFVLDEVRPLPFIPCKGALGFFKPDLTGAIPVTGAGHESTTMPKKTPGRATVDMPGQLGLL